MPDISSWIYLPSVYTVPDGGLSYDGVKAVRILQKLLEILNLDLSPGLAIGGTIFL